MRAKEKTHIQQKAFTVREQAQARLAGEKSVAAPTAPSRCTMISATSNRCVLRARLNVFDVNGNLREFENSPGSRPHGRPLRLLEKTNHKPPHRSGWQKNQARPLPGLVPLLGFCCGGRQRVQKSAADRLMESLKAFYLYSTFCNGQGFQKRQDSEREPRKATRARNKVWPGDRRRAYIRRNLGDVQEDRLCQARHHCPEFRDWYDVYQFH